MKANGKREGVENEMTRTNRRVKMKVHNAYRVAEDVDPWGFVMEAKRKAEQEIVSELRLLFSTLMENTEFMRFVKKEMNLTKDAGLMDLGFYVHQKYGEQLHSLERSPYDFDAGMQIRRHNRRFFIACYFDPRNRVTRSCFDFLKTDRRAEPYWFHSGIDIPEGVPAEEWHERGRTWQEIYERGWDDCLTAIVMSHGKFLELVPSIDMALEEYKKTGKLSF